MARNWSDFCTSCAAKRSIIMLSHIDDLSFDIDKIIHRCTDPQCSNACDPWRRGPHHDSPLDELSESQLLLFAHLQFNDRKEWEKLSQLMAIPFEKMTPSQTSEVQIELDRFYQEILRLIAEKSEDAATSSSNQPDVGNDEGR